MYQEATGFQQYACQGGRYCHVSAYIVIKLKCESRFDEFVLGNHHGRERYQFAFFFPHGMLVHYVVMAH